jgi:hypothetical protein
LNSFLLAYETGPDSIEVDKLNLFRNGTRYSSYLKTIIRLFQLISLDEEKITHITFIYNTIVIRTKMTSKFNTVAIYAFKQITYN